MINVELAQIAIAAPLIVFPLYLLIGMGDYTKSTKKSFNFLTDFPYEFNPRSQKNHGLHALTVYFLAGIITNISMFVNFYSAASEIVGLLILSAFLTLAFYVFVYRIHTLTASLEKSHLGRFYVMGLVLILLSSVNGILFINLSKGNEEMKNIILGLSIGMFIVSAASFIILLNPRLKNWAKLEKVVDEDGASSLKRPKPFVLAFSEWLIIFLSVISWLLAAISNYLLIK